MEKAVNKPAERLWVRREDLYLPGGPQGFDIIEITAKSDWAHTQIYPENYVFTPDSRRFVLRRRRPFNNGAKCEFLLCDMDDNYSLRQLTDEDDIIYLCNITHDGKFVLYFVTLPERRGFQLKRVDVETGAREVVMTVDKPLSGHSYVPVACGGSAVRHDGRAVCLNACIQIPDDDDMFYLTLVLDLDTCEARVIDEGNNGDYAGLHLQYARDDALHDILGQQNHGRTPDRIVGVMGCDIHVIRDDGTNQRSFPWGRDGWEQCMGHECWLGKTGWAVSSTITLERDGTNKCHIIAGKPMKTTDGQRHTGNRIPGAEHNRVDLTRDNELTPFTCHYQFDPTGVYCATDWIAGGKGILKDKRSCTDEEYYSKWDYSDVEHAANDMLLLGKITPPPDSYGVAPNAVLKPRPIMRTGSALIPAFIEPALSPDHKTVIFNCTTPGKKPQAMLARVTEDMYS